MKTLTYLLNILLLAAGLALAQSDNPPIPDKGDPDHKMRIVIKGMPGMPGMPGFGHDWWRNSELAQAINLSDAQKRQLNQIFSSHRAKLVQDKGNVEIEEGKLSDLLEADRPDQSQVLQQLSAVQNARNAMENEYTVMSLAFRNVLTPDQWKKLQEVTKERMRNAFFKHHDGERGPMPPPPQ